MQFLEELFKSTDGACLTRCIFIPNGGGYFEGVKAVGDFSPERIALCFPRETVEVFGENLSIKKYGDGDLQLSVQITCIKVEHGAV